MGVGIALFLAMVTLELAEAAVIWVEAAALVRTRATTKARTIVFTNMAFILCYLS